MRLVPLLQVEVGNLFFLFLSSCTLVTFLGLDHFSIECYLPPEMQGMRHGTPQLQPSTWWFPLGVSLKLGGPFYGLFPFGFPLASKKCSRLRTPPIKFCSWWFPFYPVAPHPVFNLLGFGLLPETKPTNRTPGNPLGI